MPETATTSAPLTPEDFQKLTNVSRETMVRLGAFADILRHWQSKVNLVGRVTLTDIWRRHMLDSAQLVPYVPENAREIVDMGSGGGFPGLVMAILLDRPVHLIEASGKKAAFLREAARVARAPAIIHNCRIEDLDPWPADVVTARALAPLDRLLAYAMRFLGPPGDRQGICLFLKGGTARREMREAGEKWTMTAECLPSITDPEGAVLRIRDLARE